MEGAGAHVVRFTVGIGTAPAARSHRFYDAGRQPLVREQNSLHSTDLQQQATAEAGFAVEVYSGGADI